MKSYGVTIQMKLLQQYFHMVLFTCIKYVLPTFDSEWNLMVLPFEQCENKDEKASYYLFSL